MVKYVFANIKPLVCRKMCSKNFGNLMTNKKKEEGAIDKRLSIAISRRNRY